ncbi:ion transporter [Reinekea sp. G2M2-21]|jgi:voltage-gated potassium channel|uniref:ion transporter n=1 Tax=Reinekea sp. G2M2-21 TaxID=2788942 RepID=UPI0018A9DEB0|nr:ion transporter [Reinekea sp. G2M2-21]MDX1342827.1 ion transporter [Reinekea sp.]
MAETRTNKFHILRSEHEQVPLKPWQLMLNDVIFGAESKAGKTFDVLLIIAIILSVLAVMLESVTRISVNYGRWLYYLEWVFTIAFTIEYLLRLSCVRYPIRYVFSFYGIVDLLSVIPTYLSIFVAGANTLLVIRILRILRVFRVLKLFSYMHEAEQLALAMRSSKRKIFVFLYFVSTIVVVFGAIMYLVEGPANGFTSIPKSVYWAIVTLTTVGYGDIAPSTPFGQLIASATMITGYAIIAVPTGIYTAELTQVMRNKRDARGCTGCGKTGHEIDAKFCRLCGHPMPEQE